MGRSYWVGRGFLARSRVRGVAPRGLALASQGLEGVRGRRVTGRKWGWGDGTSDRVLIVATDAGRAGMVQEPQASPDLYFPHPGNLVPSAPAQPWARLETDAASDSLCAPPSRLQTRRMVEEPLPYVSKSRTAHQELNPLIYLGLEIGWSPLPPSWHRTQWPIDDNPGTVACPDRHVASMRLASPQKQTIKSCLGGPRHTYKGSSNP